MTTLLDASAVLALLNEETGADVVEATLDDAAISTVNAAEVAAKLNEVGWTADDIAPLFEQLQLEILPFELEAALASGQLRTPTKKHGLSLGDRACLATALTTKYMVLTADKEWMKFKIRGITIKCLR